MRKQCQHQQVQELNNWNNFSRNRSSSLTMPLRTPRPLLLPLPPPLRWHSSFEHGGWVFERDEYELRDLRGDRVEEIPYGLTEPVVFSMKHVKSGVKFTFDYLDIILMNQNPPDSDVPTYDSPLEPLGLDCAYAGRISTEEQSFFPDWEDLESDIDSLVDQFSWTTKLGSGRPRHFQHYVSNARKEKPQKNPLVNSMDRVFVPSSQERFYCNFHLLVTEFGWVFHLFQCVRSCESFTRIRMMTMHCNFEQNTVFREITEAQSGSLDGGVRISPCNEENDKMCVHFHEVKQFNIQGSNSQRGSSSTSSNLKKEYVGGIDIPDWKVGSLFANCGKDMKAIEALTGTRIHIIPAFQRPHDPYFPNYPGVKSMRKAYIDGLDVERSKSCFHGLLMTTGGKSKERGGITDDIVDLFGPFPV